MNTNDQIKNLIENNLKNYNVVNEVEDKQYFKKIDEYDNISILMGSRAFYEGWDSNRPNLILYINIGVGTEAEKFVLQSIGRGVRIEPLKNKKKRLLELYNNKEDDGWYGNIGKIVPPLETLLYK